MKRFGTWSFIAIALIIVAIEAIVAAFSVNVAGVPVNATVFTNLAAIAAIGWAVSRYNKNGKPFVVCPDHAANRLTDYGISPPKGTRRNDFAYSMGRTSGYSGIEQYNDDTYAERYCGHGTGG